MQALQSACAKRVGPAGIWVMVSVGRAASEQVYGQQLLGRPT